MICAVLVVAYSIAVAVLFQSPSPIPLAAYRANGTSMYPVIKNGDVVVVYKNAKFGVGDVIAFKQFGRRICHRVIGEYAAGRVVETKGDNARSADPLIVREDVIGRVVFVFSFQILFLPHLFGLAIVFALRGGVT